MTSTQQLQPRPHGPWDNEPDRVEWSHGGFPCLIVRGPLGALCGYVAVPASHPWHGVDSDVIGAEVHGGITYSRACEGDICHVPPPGEPDDVWWLGFDAAHCYDVIPGPPVAPPGVYPLNHGLANGTYRTIGYMRAECERLAEQAGAVSCN